MACPKCKSRMQVGPELAGQHVGCPTCGATILVPPRGGPSGQAGEIAFLCPACKGQFAVPSNLAGHKSKCPQCGTTLLIPSASTEAPPPPSSEEPPAPAPSQPSGPPPVHPDLPPGGPAVEQPSSTAASCPASRPQAAEGASGLPFPARQIEALVGLIRSASSPQVLVTWERYAFAVIAYAMLGLAPIFLVAAACLVWGSQEGLRVQLPAKMAWLLVAAAGAMVVCQFVVSKVRLAGLKVIESSPSSMSTTHVTDCLPVVFFLAALAGIPAGVYMAWDVRLWAGRIAEVLPAIVHAFVAFLAAVACLHPQSVHVTPRRSAGAGNEAIGLLSFLLKMSLRLFPLVLGVQLMTAYLKLGLGLYDAIDAGRIGIFGAAAAFDLAHMPAFGGSPAPGPWSDILNWTAIYVVVYLMFLAYQLVLDVARAVFQIAHNTRRDDK